MNIGNSRIASIKILIGVIIIRGFATGLNVIAGLFLSPVSQELGVGIGNLSLYLSIMSIVQVLWFGLAGRLLNQYDIRIVAGVSAVFQALSFAAFGFMGNVWGWYLLAVPLAMGSAVLVNLLGPILINRWFPGRNGMMLGIVSACVGLFGAVLQPVTSGMIADDGWRNAYRVMGVIAFVAMMSAILIFIRNGQLKGEKETSEATGDSLQQNTMEGEKMEQRERLEKGTNPSRSTFVGLLLFMITLTGVAVFVQHIPTYGNLLGYSVKQVGNALSFSSIGTALGALVIGVMADKVGSLKTCYLIIGLWILSMAGFLLSDGNFIVFVIATFLNGVAIPGVTILSPILTIGFYGREQYEQIYAKISAGAPLAAIFLVPVYGFIFDISQSYTFVLWILIGLLVVAGISIYIPYNQQNLKSRE